MKFLAFERLRSPRFYSVVLSSVLVDEKLYAFINPVNFDFYDHPINCWNYRGVTNEYPNFIEPLKENKVQPCCSAERKNNS